MKNTPNSLDRMLDLARRAQPAPENESTTADVAFLARQSFAAAQRATRAEDSLRTWEHAGRWSLAGAAAMVLLVAVLRPAPAAPNPFDAFGETITPNSELFFQP